MATDKLADIEEQIEEAREEFFREAREEFDDPEQSADRWKEFTESDEIQEMWRDAENEAWQEEQERLESEWRDKLAELTGA